MPNISKFYKERNLRTVPNQGKRPVHQIPPLPFNRSLSNPIKLCYPSTSSTSNLTSHGGFGHEPSNFVASLLRFSLKSNAMSGRSRPLKFINSNSLGADHKITTVGREMVKLLANIDWYVRIKNNRFQTFHVDLMGVVPRSRRGNREGYIRTWDV